jgi:hypothetical protein
VAYSRILTDEILYPTRGRHWYDGGHFQRFHEHTWTPETPHLNNTWNYSFRWVNQANMLILQLQQLENIDPALRDAFIAELKTIRALGYWYLIDNFGNVPIVDRFDVEPGYSPPIIPIFRPDVNRSLNLLKKILLKTSTSLLQTKTDQPMAVFINGQLMHWQ